MKQSSESDSFGEMHERLAREAIEQCSRNGTALLECLQGKYSHSQKNFFCGPVRSPRLCSRRSYGKFLLWLTLTPR